jgi:gamma-glutamylcysteine synthetase
VAQDVVKLAKEGLVRRGRNEEVFLAPIEEVASSGTILTKIHGA